LDSKIPAEIERYLMRLIRWGEFSLISKSPIRIALIDGIKDQLDYSSAEILDGREGLDSEGAWRADKRRCDCPNVKWLFIHIGTLFFKDKTP
jgi:hypothetical protein